MAVPTSQYESYGDPRLKALLGRIWEVHCRKARDYVPLASPNSNLRASEKLGIPAWVGVLLRMNDKMTRLNEFAKTGHLANEGVEDTLLDLANYSLLDLILYEEFVKERTEAYERKKANLREVVEQVFLGNKESKVVYGGGRIYVDVTDSPAAQQLKEKTDVPPGEVLHGEAGHPTPGDHPTSVGEQSGSSQDGGREVVPVAQLRDGPEIDGRQAGRPAETYPDNPGGTSGFDGNTPWVKKDEDGGLVLKTRSVGPPNSGDKG